MLPSLYRTASLVLFIFAVTGSSAAQVERDELATDDTVASSAYSVLPVSEWAIGLRGFGPVRFGMTVAEAEAASGVRLQVAEPEVGDGTCSYASIVGGPDVVSFMVERRGAWRIKSVEISGIVESNSMMVSPRPAQPVTLSGVGVGSTFAQVRRAYPGQVRASPDSYGGPSRLVFTPRADRDFLVLFNTQDGRSVSAISAGYRGWADAPEGCA